MREETTTAGPATWIAAALALVLGLALLVPLARFVDTSSRWLDYPYPRAGSEGLILYETLLVKHGGDIYGPITPQQFISGPYPPIYYLLASWTLPPDLPALDVPGSVQSIFLGGRTISLLATLLAGASLALLVVFAGGYHLRGTRATLLAAAAGLLAGGLLLTLPQVTVWATRFRGDMLMVGLSAAGLACLAVGAPADDTVGPRLKWVLLLSGAVLFSLAFFTKQTAIAPPLASGAYLLVRDWRSGLRWCAVMALCVLVPFGLLDLATGHWFYLKMVDYHSLPVRPLTLTRLLQFAFWENQWPLILVAIGFALFGLGLYARALVERRQSSNLTTRPALKPPLLIPMLALAATVTLPTGAVVGADHNHLLLPGLSVCACVGAALAWLFTMRFSMRSAAPLAGGSVVLVLVALYCLVTSPPGSWYDPDLTVPSPQVQEQLRKIVLNVRQNPGNLFFADDPGIVALAGKQTPYDDPFTMTALAEQSRWDESYYRSMLQGGKFSLLVLSCDVTAGSSCRGDTFTPGALDSIRAGYRLLFRDVLYTYAPR